MSCQLWPWVRLARSGAGPFSQQTQEGDMSEGPAMVRARRRKIRSYAAIAAATVMGSGLAVGATAAGAAPVSAAATVSAAPGTSTTGSVTFRPGIEVLFFPQTYQLYATSIAEDAVVVVKG